MLPANQNDLFSELVRLRRMFHKIPETGFTEFWTTARICQYLEKLDCDLIYGKQLREALTEPGLLDTQLKPQAYDTCLEKYPDDEWIKKLEGIPGAVAIFKGDPKGPKFGLRFDIDGLPIVESTQDSHLPAKEGFASENDNMHACGHDGHVTMGLGLAKTLSGNLANASGTYYLIFQPAEEVILGGRVLSKLNFIKELDYFFAAHMGMSGPGMITCGVSFFADKKFHVIFKGKRAHAGGAPHAGKNALIAASTAVTGLYGISRHSGGDSRINIGEFKSGNAVNIIPDHAEFDLEIRSATNPVMEYLASQAENIIKGAAMMQDTDCKIEFITETVVAPNSDPMITEVRKACMDIGMKPEKVVDRLQISGSEDATFIMNEVLENGGQTTFIGVGAPSGGPHHNENFDFNEQDLLRGVNLLYRLTQNISQQK